MHRDIGPIIGLIAVMGFFAIPIVAVIGHYFHETLKAWWAASLKRDMIARGYTAQEIIEILAADSGTKAKSSLPNVPPAKPIKQPVFGP
jgi:hypothetical protein